MGSQMSANIKTLLSLSFFGAVGLLLMVPEQAGATQVHVPSEGLYVHQIAHLFFAAAMAILLYWLRERQLVRQRGWRLIQLGACFFIFWNLDAFAVHILDGRSDLFTRIDLGTWHESIQFDPNLELPAVLYYLGKMDHLWCAPGMILLYFGLRSLLAEAEKARALSPSAGEYSGSGSLPRELSASEKPASLQDNGS
jgi:hypothetical protein